MLKWYHVTANYVMNIMHLMSPLPRESLATSSTKRKYAHAYEVSPLPSPRPIKMATREEKLGEALFSVVYYATSLRDSVQYTRDIIARGANVNWVSRTRGTSALVAASTNGHVEIVRLLLQNGASVDLQCNDGWTPLMGASEEGHIEVAKLLLQEGGAKVNFTDSEGWSALMSASGRGHTDVVKLLLQYGAQVNHQRSDGWCALIHASSCGHTETTQLLLQNGAAVDLQRNDGWSALMSASQSGHTEVAKLLLRNGAQINLKDTLGRSPMTLARNTEMVQLLQTNGEGRTHVSS